MINAANQLSIDEKTEFGRFKAFEKHCLHLLALHRRLLLVNYISQANPSNEETVNTAVELSKASIISILSPIERHFNLTNCCGKARINECHYRTHSMMRQSGTMGEGEIEEARL